MGIKENELKIWHALLEHEARSDNSSDHWHGELTGHANALYRLGVIDGGELRELLELADAAYSSVMDR
jgi:hypothetical protein